MGSELGRTEPQNFGADVHLHHPYLFRPTHSLNMREAIVIEIKKEEIRQGIIMFEIVRRRIEAAVRRELMTMDRELDLQRNSNGFPFLSSPMRGFDLPHLETTAEGRSLEERIVLNRSLEDGKVETPPFRKGTADLRNSEVKPIPVNEVVKENDKVILPAKPDENISGSKRKAVTPQPGRDFNEFPSDGVLKKKAKVEWSCGLCQVHVNSERVLNEHLQGKKHKAKEAALANTAGKNCIIGLLPKKTTESMQHVGAFGPGNEASSKSDDLRSNLNSDNLKKNEPAEVQKVQKNGYLNKRGRAFCCEMCLVFISSEKVMNAHKKGKQHVRLLQQIHRNGGAAPSDQKSIKREDHKLVSETKPVDGMIKPNGGVKHKELRNVSAK